MSRRVHMCADIRGMLKNHSRKGSLKNVFTEDNGRKSTDDEARDYLYDCLSKGWKVIPFGECDNFDYQTGCRGHELKEADDKGCENCRWNFGDSAAETCIDCHGVNWESREVEDKCQEE